MGQTCTISCLLMYLAWPRLALFRNQGKPYAIQWAFFFPKEQCAHPSRYGRKIDTISLSNQWQNLQL